MAVLKKIFLTAKGAKSAKKGMKISTAKGREKSQKISKGLSLK
jgi:hypothetical protein